MIRSKGELRYLPILALVVATTSSCRQEVDYQAKFCAGSDAVFYVTDDLKTFFRSGMETHRKYVEGEPESGKILKIDRGDYFEFSGPLNFRVDKQIDGSRHHEGFSNEKLDDVVSIVGSSQDGTKVEYFVDSDGKLVQMDEFLGSVAQPDVVSWQICGGSFKVN